MGSIKFANCKSRNKDNKIIPSVLHKGNFKKKKKKNNRHKVVMNTLNRYQALYIHMQYSMGPQLPLL